jgi:hypothetical protein
MFNAKIRRENSMAKKFDGVIEAVRYKNGQIEVVRAFERRGATFSDRIMLPRHELLERLKKGKKFVIGKRRELLASTFDVQDKSVQVVDRDGTEIIATRADADHDELEQAPVF